MLLKVLLAALAAHLVVTASAQNPDKPTIKPPMKWDRMENDLRRNLSPANSTRKYWSPGWIPATCKDFADGHNLSSSNFTVFNVNYDDCSEPWIFCRHMNATASELDMIEMFGRMPVRMRSYVRQFMATPAIDDSIAALWMYPGDILMASWPLATTLAHEMSHGLDYMALQQYGFPFSGTSHWRDNYTLDSAVPSDYSRTNFVENFAENGIVGFYDKVVPGGVASIQPNWKAIFHQYSTYQAYLGDKILPGGRCRVRIVNSETVPVGDADSRVALGLGPKPEVGFKDSSIAVVRIDPSLVGLTLVHSEHH